MRAVLIVVIGVCALSAAALLSCGDIDRRTGIGVDADGERTIDRSPYVVALGNLGRGESPSRTEMQLSEFLFGTVPEPPLGLVKPVAIAPRGDELLICDSALNGVFQYDAGSGLSELRLDPAPGKPVGIGVSKEGAVAIADAGANVVMLYEPSGKLRSKLAADDGDFRPADAVFLANQIWASNAAASRIEVFDATTGAFVRAIGARGNARGEFGVPLGMATANNGAVYIVDMLNDRVQLVDRGGQWVRTVGRGGDRVGSFGRPKDVAVGPDGTIFVVDAASQRVHAFSSDGQPLLAFGAPGTGRGALSMPAGICVAPAHLADSSRLPPGMQIDYLVAVAEQLDDPGIRLFGWSASAAADARVQESRRTVVRRAGTADAANPHWAAQKCNACHQMSGSVALPIPADRVDPRCLSCHDGRRARAEPHPIGRLANHSDIKTPVDWPLSDDRLSCITCHDIQRHCDRSAVRPTVNSALLRFHEPERPLAFCTKCHEATDSWRLSPHDQLAADGRIRAQTCAFCHNESPPIPPDGRRRHAPDLRAAASDVCLTCHTKHWDFFPEGHVERPTTRAIRARMTERADRGESVLPLIEGRVTCFTCHNPHAPGLFPEGSQLGSRATDRVDASIVLRLNRTDLCLTCHLK